MLGAGPRYSRRHYLAALRQELLELLIIEIIYRYDLIHAEPAWLLFEYLLLFFTVSLWLFLHFHPNPVIQTIEINDKILLIQIKRMIPLVKWIEWKKNYLINY